MSETDDSRETDVELEALMQEIGAREQPDSKMTDAVRELVHAEWLAVVHERRRMRWKAATLAIAASVVLTAGILLFVLPRSGVEPVVARVDRLVGDGAVLVSGGDTAPVIANTQVHAEQTLRTASNVRAALQLAPHLEVRMDQNSEAKFVAADRIVLYRGALYVDASGPQSAPLSIETPFGNIQHVGTQYETRLEESALRIRVRTGEVRWVRDSEETTAQAGEQLSVSKSGVSREPIAVSGGDWQWLAQVAARFELENHSVAEFLDWAGHEMGCEVVYASERAHAAAREVILHGSVEGLTPDSALAAVLSTTHFTYTQAANRITIAMRP